MQEVQNLNVLESVKMQRAGFIQQRDQMQVNFQQLVGAIHACDNLIQQYEDSLKEQPSTEDKPNEEVPAEDLTCQQ